MRRRAKRALAWLFPGKPGKEIGLYEKRPGERWRRVADSCPYCVAAFDRKPAKLKPVEEAAWQRALARKGGVLLPEEAPDAQA